MEITNMTTVPQSYQVQCFCLPKPIINYIFKHPASPEAYLKLIKTCKIIFLYNPILIVHALLFYNDEWKTAKIPIFKTVTSLKKKSSARLWLTNLLDVYDATTLPYEVSSFIPKIYQSNIKELFLENQNITLNDLIFLGSLSAKKCSIVNSNVLDSDGTHVSYFSVLKELPFLTFLLLDNTEFYQNINQIDMNEVVKISLKLKHFHLLSITEAFDIQKFYHALKSHNSSTHISLWFHENISPNYANCINNVVDNIIATHESTSFNFVPPKINSIFVSPENEEILLKINRKERAKRGILF